MNGHGQTVCLNMIVRNEAPVILRCLDSVLPIIDAWAIVDTGSTDGTQDLVRERLRDLPGTLIERPWVDFAHNRTEAIELAGNRADYLFFIDADEVLVRHAGFRMPHLTADAYDCLMRFGGVSYLRRQLVRSALPWKWHGVVHECVQCDEPVRVERLTGFHTEPHRDGARARDLTTCRRDALILERALLDDPENSRYVFYLAQSYASAGDFELALRHYRRRATMGGWPDEVWTSLQNIASLRERLGAPWPEVMADYLAAFEHSPDRAEPLYRIGSHFQRVGEHHTAYVFLREAVKRPQPSFDRLFIEHEVYEYQAAAELSAAAYATGRHVEGTRLSNQLLRANRIPPDVAEQIVRNRHTSFDQRPGVETELADPPIAVIVPVGAGEEEAAEGCLDSIAIQDQPLFHAIVIAAEPVRLPEEDARFSAVSADPPDRIAVAVSEVRALPGNTAVMMLSPHDRLAHSGVLRGVVDDFQRTGCTLWYGQYRSASGARGNAEPAPDAEAFRKLGSARAGRSTLVFRADLLAGPLSSDLPVAEALWQRAGFERTRFSEAAATIVDSVRTNPREPQPQPATAAVSVLPSYPKVSCLMLSRDRLLLADRAIRAFAAQSYPNRELVVVSQGTAAYRRALENAFRRHGVAGVKLVTADEKMTIGELRNLAMEAASGEILCQWDDDDYSHRDRVLMQAEALLAAGAHACYLTSFLQYLEPLGVLYLNDWTMDGRNARPHRLFEPSLMLRQGERFRFPAMNRAEDTAMRDALCESVQVAELMAPHLYVYQFHGRNVTDTHHHRRLAIGASYPMLTTSRPHVEETITAAGIGRPLRVFGRDGFAYLLE